MHDSADSVPVKRGSALIGAALVLAGAFGFSAKAVFAKLAYQVGAIDAISLMALRMALSLPFFLVAAWWVNREPGDDGLGRNDWMHVVLLGITGYYLASYLDFYGLTFIPVALERLILFLYPTMVVVFSALMVPRKIRRGEFEALCLCYGGILLVFLQTSDTGGHALWTGSALVFASAVAFAIFMMGSGRMVRRMGSARFTAYSMSIACIATALHFALVKPSGIMDLPPKVYTLAALMAVFSTVLPSFLINAGIRQLGSGRVSVMSSIGPVMTLFLGYWLLDEALTAVQLLGAGLVIAGVYRITREE